MKIGDIVSRISHNNDINFIILEIKDKVALLKGTDIRLYADADLEDLVLSDKVDDYRPTLDTEMLERDEYFYLPGKILHIDGDIDYLNKSLTFYKECDVLAIGKQVKESDMPNTILKLLNETRPDILVITGHDAYYDKNGDINNINNYKNSKYFRDTILKAREYEKSHEKLVIVAGACQSDYEDLIKSGANFASSPKRVNIHALDPAVIAVNVSLTKRDEMINIKELLSKTKYGKNGIGGILGNGMMYVGYPR
ncbi:MAG: hypothetical protein J1F35_02765 [Erysipelotrichales bacterium]|nr:hypothetical protein [Erysipelotrichales bacterium]